MADFRKCREDAGLPLHMIAEDPGRLSDVDQVAVTVEYAVQGKGALLALKTLKSKDTNIVLLIGCPLSSDPEDMVIARPTQARELQGERPDSLIKQDISNLNCTSYHWFFRHDVREAVYVFFHHFSESKGKCMALWRMELKYYHKMQ